MGNTWICNIRHFMDDNGNLVNDLPSPARNLAEYLGKIISYITQTKRSWERQNLKILCRRRPKRKPCQGEIHAYMFIEEEPKFSHKICWYCPVCDDNGIISEWEYTFYDCFDPDEEENSRIVN